MQSSIDTESAREARVRRWAQRIGLQLQKSRSRRFPESGTYQLVDPYCSNVVIARGSPNRFGLDLDDIEFLLRYGLPALRAKARAR